MELLLIHFTPFACCAERKRLGLQYRPCRHETDMHAYAEQSVRSGSYGQRQTPEAERWKKQSSQLYAD
jgi:hypothetical protein